MELKVKEPKVRFGEFTGDWEECKLEDILDEFSSKSRIENEHVVLSSTNSGMEIRGGRVSGNSNLGYKIIEDGDLVLSPQNLWLGNININNIGVGLVSPSYKTFKIKNINSGFLGSQLRMPRMLEAYKNSSTQGASVVRRNLELDSFYQITINTPSKNEQDRINTLFKNINKTIEFKENQLEQLKESKKTLLSKMFPKEGADRPEIRFAGFTDPWEQCRLGNHAEILTGGTPKTSIPEYWEPKTIPWMSSGEVNKRRLDETDNMISEEGLNNSSARWVKENSVLIALAGQGKTRGTVAINNIPLTTNQSIAAVVPDESLHYEFIFQNLIMRYDELRTISSGDGTRGGLNKQILSDVIVPFPSKDEQIKIGSFFTNLDYFITLHQQELENLKVLKKTLLNLMFV